MQNTNPTVTTKALNELIEIVTKLRNPNSGCPWDLEQTHISLIPYLLEEAHEVADAIRHGNDTNLKEELGDLFLQILLHAQIASEESRFSLADIAQVTRDKLVRRHPHVFGDVELESAEDVEKQWEEIKKQETSDSIFDDIDQKLPSITKAFKTQRKAKKLDLTYTNYQEALQDLLSEVEELKDAKNDEDRKSEIGDILFSVVNICRYLEADPEIQLNKSTQRFIERAKYVEKNADPSIDIETLWEEAKKSQLK